MMQLYLSSGNGNGKIDSYPPREELKIRKILIIQGEIFQKIKRELESFKKWLSNLQVTKKNDKRKVSFRNRHKRYSESGRQNKSRNDNQPKHQSIYTPTDIWDTRGSNLWKWRRAKKWIKEFTQENEIMKEKMELKEIRRLTQNKSFIFSF